LLRGKPFGKPFGQLRVVSLSNRLKAVSLSNGEHNGRSNNFLTRPWARSSRSRIIT